MGNSIKKGENLIIQSLEELEDQAQQNIFDINVVSDNENHTKTEDESHLSDNQAYNQQPVKNRSKMAQLKSILFTRPSRKLMSKFTHGSMKSSIFNLTTATIGAGVLSVPRSFYYSGIYLSVLLYLVCALLGYISNILLVKCAERLKKYTYMGLAEKTQNKFMVIFIKINFLIANWGFVVAYIILVNKTFAKTIEIFWPESPNFLRDTDGKFWAPIIMVVVVFPLSLFRSLGALRFVALMSVCISCYITLIIFIEPLTMTLGSLSTKYEKARYFEISGLFITFSTGLFAFTCQNNTLDIYNELQNPIRRRISKVIFITMTICFSLYCLAGIFGYLTFADNTDMLTNPKYGGIILLADYKQHVEIIFSLMLIGFNITFALPFNTKPCKDCLVDIFYPGLKFDRNISHFFFTAIICISSLISGLYIPMMSDVITLMGAVSSPLVCFVFPTLFYLKTYPNTKPTQKYILIVGFIIFMTLYALFGLIDFFLKISDKMVKNS